MWYKIIKIKSGTATRILIWMLYKKNGAKWTDKNKPVCLSEAAAAGNRLKSRFDWYCAICKMRENIKKIKINVDSNWVLFKLRNFHLFCVLNLRNTNECENVRFLMSLKFCNSTPSSPFGCPTKCQAPLHNLLLEHPHIPVYFYFQVWRGKKK